MVAGHVLGLKRDPKRSPGVLERFSGRVLRRGLLAVSSGGVFRKGFPEVFFGSWSGPKKSIHFFKTCPDNTIKTPGICPEEFGGTAPAAEARPFCPDLSGSRDPGAAAPKRK
jgi:hypothetical protein